MNKYKIVSNYKHNNELRRSLIELSKKTFGLDFEEWYQKGLWLNNYKCHSIIIENQVVANVSTTEMTVNYNGKTKNIIQIGTVMTDEKHRKKGYCKLLMDYAMELYKDADAIFLFSGVDMFKYYSQFGFESKSRKTISSEEKFEIKNKFNFRKFDINNQHDIELLVKIAENRVVNNDSLYFSEAHTILYFYIIFAFSNETYIDEEQETIIIYSKDDSTIHVKDLISTKHISYREVFESIVDQNTTKLNFEFDINSEDIKLIKENFDTVSNDSLLLIKGDFDCSEHLFPTTYHA